jgi:diguanylate cyclase (GGDEF)-like protein/PAS domain S-box-containing protein
MSERYIDNLDELRLEPVCRMACALLGVPASAIIIANGHGLWSHVAEAGFEPSWASASINDIHRDDSPDVHLTDEVRRMESAGKASVKYHTTAATFCASIGFGPGDVGTLIVIDRKSRILSPEDIGRMADLGQIAGQLLSQHIDRSGFSQQLNFYRMLAEVSTETIVRGTLDGVRLYVSPSVRELLGYEPDELIGRRAADLTHPDDLGSFGAMMNDVREGRLDRGTHELRQRHKDGSWVWMEASLRLTRDRLTNTPNGYVASVRDIGRRKELETRLERLAGYDDLSGLPNRALFRKILTERLAEDRRLTLLYMDLDDFKEVNDRFGHATGDAVLREFAARLGSHVRTDDIIARLGGDEFTAIVESRGKDIASLCKRLIAAASTPFLVGDTEIKIGLSIGVANASGSDENLDALLSRADRALYDAKNVGKNRYRLAMVA